MATERRRGAARACGLLIGCGLLAGCAPSGLLYTHVVEPATTEYRATPAGTKTNAVRGHRLREPVTGAGVTAEWDMGTVQAVARRAGMTHLDYADQETLSILNVYRRRTLILYGD